MVPLRRRFTSPINSEDKWVAGSRHTDQPARRYRSLITTRRSVAFWSLLPGVMGLRITLGTSASCVDANPATQFLDATHLRIQRAKWLSRQHPAVPQRTHAPAPRASFATVGAVPDGRSARGVSCTIFSNFNAFSIRGNTCALRRGSTVRPKATLKRTRHMAEHSAVMTKPTLDCAHAGRWRLTNRCRGSEESAVSSLADNTA